MNVQLLLFGLALILRGIGGLLRKLSLPIWLRGAGWLLSSTAVWLAFVAVGAWAPVWPILPVALLAFIITTFRQTGPDQGRSVSPVFDLILVVVAGLFSIPPEPFISSLVYAVILALTARMVDWAAAQIQKRMATGLLVGIGMLPIVLLLVIPLARETGARLLGTRFDYLLPASEMPSIPTAVPQETAVSPHASAELATPIATPPVQVDSTETSNLNASGTQWAPYIEWRLTNPTIDGNPFDLIAQATFVHTESGETRTTGLFYTGEETWRFRFTGTLPGEWTFTTSSEDADLDGHTGMVTIAANPSVPGFVTHYGDKWGRTGTNEAFVPQLVMIGSPHTYYNNPAEIQAAIQTFFVEHGFNGVHTPVFCRWFMLEKPQCSRINEADPNPDFRTFEALEALITEVHAAGGIVHIWMWGDDSRSQNPKRWGLNETADLRLQRYIAARLGPLPGWTMGYGFDLFEWVNGDQLTTWRDHMQDQMGWFHYLGARSSKNRLDQLSEAMDYSAYEQHRPGYDLYVRTIDARPDKPSFSEDRFRIRDEDRAKDYNMAQTRRGLWHSTMAGGVANIWGNLIGAPGANDGSAASAPYPNPEMIKTYARFWQNRFWAELQRCNERSSQATCLMAPDQSAFVFYSEETESVEMDLTGMPEGATAVAVDTKIDYAEIEIGRLEPGSHSWQAPYVSDWAIAVGD